MHDISVFIVTWRRHEMLKRAIASVLDQTCEDFRCQVVNDDPLDSVVREIVTSFNDPRLNLYYPLEKRGPARNFNLMFDEPDARYVTLLEDDNWWQPTFLEVMKNYMDAHTEVDVVCSNERVWRENADGSWVDTGVNVWLSSEDEQYNFELEKLCGSAKLCNSAMLYRVGYQSKFLTPDDIPVDVTEHFRERTITGNFGLIPQPLVNYAETLATARRGDRTWGEYQVLLIGSAFAALTSRVARERLATILWKQCRSATSPRAVTLMMTGLGIVEARPLLRVAPTLAWMRLGAKMLRRPFDGTSTMGVRRRRIRHFTWLRDTPLTRKLARRFEENASSIRAR